MWFTRRFRSQTEAAEYVAALNTQKGTADRHGRMTETLLGCELYEWERGGQPLYTVQPVVSVRDPLYDA
jgi:hypothetical protein